MLVPVAAALIFLVVIYLLFLSKQEKVEVQEEEPQTKASDKQDESQLEPQQAASGNKVSYKKLKQQHSKKATHSGKDPKDLQSYITAFKTLITDIDSIQLDGALSDKLQNLVVFADSNHQVHAHVLSQAATPLATVEKTASASLKVSQTVCSVSISKPKGSAKFIVALGCFEECALIVYSLAYSTESQELKFSQSEMYKIPKTHDVPIAQVRLSRQQAHFAVTCGENKDIWLKLFNLQTQQPEHSFKTSHARHLTLAHGKELDLFSVVGTENEVRIYQILPGHKQSYNLEKVTTLLHHKHAVNDVAISGDYVVTLSSQESLICLHKVDVAMRKNTLIQQKTVELDSNSKVQILKVPGKTQSDPDVVRVIYTDAQSDLIVCDGNLMGVKKINEPHNGDATDQLLLLGLEVALSVSKTDRRVNVWSLN